MENNNITGSVPIGTTNGASNPTQPQTPLFADVTRTPLTPLTAEFTDSDGSASRLVRLPLTPRPIHALQTEVAAAQTDLAPPNNSGRKILIRGMATILVLAIMGVSTALFIALQNRPAPSQTSSSIESTTIPLSEFSDSGSLNLLGGQSLIVNGQLRANESFVLAPQTQPTAGERGQIYYDTTADQLAYYNGTQFIKLPGSDFVQSFQGQSGNVTLSAGNGITITGTTFTNNGVISIGGQSGDISLGTGLTISGTTLQTTGVQNIVSGGPQITVTNDGAGTYTISSSGGGTGTVTSTGGSANTIPMFTAAQNIEDSIITQSGGTITVTGSLSVTSALTLGTPLTVANGGTGAAGLSSNGVIVGNGTSPLSSVTAAGAGLCLMSTGGAPAFSACPGSGGVTSLEGLTGVLTINNASGSGSVITIDDASTTTKGIAQFDATNFSASGGLINTIQDIDSTASPAFTGLTLSGDLAVNGGDITSSGALNITPGGTLIVGATNQTLTLQGGASTTISATSGANTTTLSFQTPGANVNYRFATAAGGSYDLCSTAGNCAGVGGGVTTPGGTPDRLAKFTAAQGIGDSTITDDGTTVTTSVDLVIQGGDVTVGLASSQTGTINFAHSGSGFSGSIVQGALGGNRTYTLPNSSGTFCLTSGNCSGSGSSSTLQAAYDAGNDITTTDGRDIDIVLANTTTDSNFDLVIADGSTGTVSISRANGAGTADPSQMVLIDNLDTSRAVATGIKLQAAAGGLTTALDTSDADIGTALAAGDNDITGGTGNLNFTNFDVLGASGDITTAGDLDVNGGDIESTGALNITPGGTLTVGASSQALTLQGNGSTTLSATSGANTNTLAFTAPSGGSKTITIGNEAGTICIQSSTNCGFAASSGSANYIQNQIASNQTADWRITGTGQANTSLLTPSLDTASAGTLSIASTTATAVTIGNATTNTSISLNSGTGTVSIGTGAQARTIDIGTGGAVQGVTIGSTNGASATVVDCGTGTCTFGASATAHTTTVGSSTGASVTNIQGGSGGVAITSGGAVNISPAANVTIGTSDTTGTLLVLDTKTDSGDPTGVNGGMYYNSNTNKFRCYQNSTWNDCVTAGTPFVQDGNTFGIAGTLGTNDAFALNLETSGTNRLTIGASGGVSIASGNAFTVSGGLTSLTAASGSGDALNVSNDSSTGNIAVFKDNSTNVATIADGGAATFQNSTNSTDGFRILNSAGSSNEVVGVDTTNSILRLLTNNTGHLTGTGTSWNTATTLPAARFAPGAVSVNGYVYSLGGCDTGDSPTTSVYYARANSDGTLSSWASTTSLPNAVCGHAATTYNGYIYVNGSTGSATTARDIWYAKPNSDGTITSWTTQNDPTNLIGLKDHGMAAYNGYLYITGGNSDDGLDTRNRNIYYGRIQADGSVPSFTVQSNWLLDQDHNPGQAIIANGYLYVMGSAGYDKFYYGRINADASVATINLATGTTTARKYASIAIMNGYMYVIAGNTSASSTIQYGQIDSTGDIAAFTTDTSTLPAARWLCPKNAPVVNNYIYLYGCASSSTATNTVYYAGGSRVKVGGGLDLVASSGEGMSEGGSGGQLTAGNTFVNGSLSVTGNSNFKDGAIVTNNFNVNGLTSLQTATDSTTGFQVLNASGTQQFVIDTTNARIYVGNVTADSTGALLVLDTKNTSGDPTGVNGGMYYNSNSRTFRCYENDQWIDCLGVPKPNTQRTTYITANGSDQNWSGYGDIITNVGPSGSGGALSSNLVPSVYNDTAASIGSVAGVYSGDIYSGDNDRLIYQTHLDTTQVNVRIWAGFTDQTIATMGASATPAGSYAAFRYDTSIESTWKCVTRNGVSATTTDSGIAIADDQKFEIVLEPGTRAVFKINGQTVCNVTGTVPNALFKVVNSLTALGAVVKTIYVGWIYVQGDPS